MFCHISVIKDDCCVVAYGCFFLPEHRQCEWRGKAKVDAESVMVKISTGSALALKWRPKYVYNFFLRI